MKAELAFRGLLERKKMARRRRNYRFFLLRRHNLEHSAEPVTTIIGSDTRANTTASATKALKAVMKASAKSFKPCAPIRPPSGWSVLAHQIIGKPAQQMAELIEFLVCP
jgi:hypothetical protein